MIVVTGEIEFHPDDAWPATAAALKMMDASAAEEGCLAYRFYTDILNLKRLRVYEEWRDEAALQAHQETEHMAAFKKTLSSLRVVERKIAKLEVASRTPL